MTRPQGPDPQSGARAALEGCWLVGRRLAQARRQLDGVFPMSPERLQGLDSGREDSLDAFLFRLGAAVAALIEDALEAVLLAEDELLLIYDVSDNLRDPERCGAIASADRVLNIRQRAWPHYRIAILAPAARAEALNAAWADGQVMLDLLVGLSNHIQNKRPMPGCPLFGAGPP